MPLSISYVKILSSILISVFAVHSLASTAPKMKGSMELECGGLILMLKDSGKGETLLTHIMTAEFTMYGVKNTPHKTIG